MVASFRSGLAICGPAPLFGGDDPTRPAHGRGEEALPYLEGIPARLETLEAALEELRVGSGQAAGTVRRMAHTLRGSGTTLGFPEVTEAAAIAEEAAEGQDLLDSTASLVEVLKGIETTGTGEPATILLIEDDPISAVMAESIIEAPEREILKAATAAEAEALLASERIDLILLDLFLPDEDGRDLLMRIRRSPSTAAVPVIVVSGSKSKAARAECFALGAEDFFAKPLDPAIFASAVSRQLKRASYRAPEARVDRLTGLANRAAVSERFEALHEEADVASVALLDIDGLHVINESHGREFGDRVLAHVGAVLDEAALEDELWARWEGEEFVALFEGEARDAAADRIREVLERLRASPLESPDGGELEITFSAGVANASAVGELRDAVAAADGCLYRARRSGEAGRIVIEGEAQGEGTGTVLLAEDDPVIASLIRHRLQKEGFEVRHYDDGSDALAGAKSHPADIAILDVKIPGMDGFQLLSELRDLPEYREVPIMMLTSMNREEDIVRGFDLGADEYVLKPFSPVELVARVRRLIRRK